MPTIPIILWLAGAKTILLTDIEPLMDAKTIRAAKDFISLNLDNVCKSLSLSADYFSNRLESFSWRYIINAQPDDFTNNSIDFIYSRAVLEQIRPKHIEQLLLSYKDKLKHLGIFVHFIDNSDHFEHRDKQISRINFLQYSVAQWRLTALNQQNYQNRLRHSQYRDLFVSTGFSIINEYHYVCRLALASTASIKLHPDFNGLDPEDLATMESIFLLRPEA